MTTRALTNSLMEGEADYDIAIAHVSGSVRIAKVQLRSAIEAALRRHQTPKALISLALVGDAHIARLSGTYLHREGPTDVLAFDLRDADVAGQSHCPSLEGEIVVSVETAAREANARGHTLEAELALYAVHGTLHLLGYDDHTEKGAVRMHEMEDEILTSIGIGAVFRSDTTMEMEIS